jgi:hypothetical protein
MGRTSNVVEEGEQVGEESTNRYRARLRGARPIAGQVRVRAGSAFASYLHHLTVTLLASLPEFVVSRVSTRFEIHWYSSTFVLPDHLS